MKNQGRPRARFISEEKGKCLFLGGGGESLKTAFIGGGAEGPLSPSPDLISKCTYLINHLYDNMNSIKIALKCLYLQEKQNLFRADFLWSELISLSCGCRGMRLKDSLHNNLVNFLILSTFDLFLFLHLARIIQTRRS